MEKHLQKFLSLLLIIFSTSAFAQNEVYWKEGFEPSAGCDLVTTVPTATPTGAYFTGNNGTSWYTYGAYRTSGSAANNCSGVISSIGVNHVRFSNAVTADSPYIVFPVVDFGIKELHMLRGRTNRRYNIYITNDTAATTTNWTYAAFVPVSANICTDTTVMINSATARRLKIVARMATDTDIDSVWITSFNQIVPVKFGAISVAEANGVVKLNWNVETESSIRNYEIQRAGSNNEYTTIGSLNANSAKYYNYIDKSINNGSFLYRVKAIGNDGKIFYSNAVKVSIGKINAAELAVYPNPVKSGNINYKLMASTKEAIK